VRRLKKYLQGRWLMVMLMILIGAGNAAAQTGGWLIVRNAIDNGIVAKDTRYLAISVGVYLAVAAAGQPAGVRRPQQSNDPGRRCRSQLLLQPDVGLERHELDLALDGGLLVSGAAVRRARDARGDVQHRDEPGRPLRRGRGAEPNGFQ